MVKVVIVSVRVRWYRSTHKQVAIVQYSMYKFEKHTFFIRSLSSLLRKQETSQILLSIISPDQLEVKDRSTLVLGNPYSSDALQGGEGVGQVLELITDQVQNRELSQVGELSRNIHNLVVTEGEESQRRAIAKLEGE